MQQIGPEQRAEDPHNQWEEPSEDVDDGASEMESMSHDDAEVGPEYLSDESGDGPPKNNNQEQEHFSYQSLVLRMARRHGYEMEKVPRKRCCWNVVADGVKIARCNRDVEMIADNKCNGRHHYMCIPLSFTRPRGADDEEDF